MRFLQNSWKQGEVVIPDKRSATRNPGFSSDSGFRRLPRTRSGVRRNDGVSDFCKNPQYF